VRRARRARHTRSGVSGSSRTRTPVSRASALPTAKAHGDEAALARALGAEGPAPSPFSTNTQEKRGQVEDAGRAVVDEVRVQELAAVVGVAEPLHHRALVLARAVTLPSLSQGVVRGRLSRWAGSCPGPRRTSRSHPRRRPVESDLGRMVYRLWPARGYRDAPASSWSAIFSQYVILISRYIVVPAARCSRACSSLPARR